MHPRTIRGFAENLRIKRAVFRALSMKMTVGTCSLSFDIFRQTLSLTRLSVYVVPFASEFLRGS